jgi:NAD(P)-dependent dehydrogenase (short-subunit alcohol dehydrogenase family)
MSLTADVTAEKAVALAVDSFGTLDIRMNNAGRIFYKHLVDMTRDDWNWQVETNVTGAFLHSREAAKVMMKKIGRDRQHRLLCRLLRLPRGSRSTPPRKGRPASANPYPSA